MRGKKAKALRKEANYNPKTKTEYDPVGEISVWLQLPRKEDPITGDTMSWMIDWKKYSEYLASTKEPRWSGCKKNPLQRQFRALPGVSRKVKEGTPRQQYQTSKVS